MVGVSGSLVEGSRHRAIRVAQGLFPLAVGCLAGAATVGVAVAVIAAPMSVIPRDIATASFAAGATMLIAIDLLSRASPYSLASWRRQTCQIWASMPHRTAANLAWGFDLGLGFTTYRVSSLYWLACIGAALLVTPAHIAYLFLFYSLGFVGGIAAGIWTTRGIGIVSLTKHSSTVRQVLIGVMLVVVALAVVTG